MFYLLLEDGFHLLLEDGTGALLLEGSAAGSPTFREGTHRPAPYRPGLAR